MALVAVLWAVLLLVAGLSLQWHMTHDAPILFYMAYGMEHFGYVPYVDFFDMNAPGTHYADALIGRVFGYGDLGFRIADLTALAALLALTWLLMRRYGRWVAPCATALFGALYLGGGPDISLQREYLALLPVAGALALATTRRARSAPVPWLLVGALLGVATTIKPGMAVGLPAVLVYGAAVSAKRGVGQAQAGSAWSVVGASLLGFAVPLAATALHLASVGALDDFLAIAGNYWPLYSSLSRTHEVILPSGRAAYLAGEWARLGGLWPWMVPAALGTGLAVLAVPKRRRQTLLLAALAVSYSVYPVVGGKFWTYHWLPFLYFAVLLSALTLIEAPRRALLRRVAIVAFLLAAALGLRPPDEVPRQLAGERWASPDVLRAERIAGFLSESLRPGDTVQPLDWTGGAVHGMLKAGARLATPFVYDFHFSHHVSTGTIQDLRARFLDELKSARPRFIIRTETLRPWVSGPDTQKGFHAVDEFVRENYREVHAGFGYRIYGRAGDNSGTTDDEGKR